MSWDCTTAGLLIKNGDTIKETLTGTGITQIDGLAAYYPFNWNANDESGKGNNGTLVGGATFTSGKIDQALLLNGTGLVNAGNASNLHVSGGDFTISAWVFFNALDGDMSIVDKMAGTGANTDGWRLIKQVDNRFWFCFGGGESNKCDVNYPSFTVFSTTQATVGVWYHVTVIKSSAGFSIYINGQLQDSRSPVPNFLDTQSANLTIGSNPLQGSYLNGLIDEVKIYNRALSASEIQQIYIGN